MARIRNPFRDRLEYYGLRGVVGLAQCFEPEQNLHSAAALGSAFFRLWTKRAHRAIDHLAKSFPDWPKEKIELTAERSIQHMLQIFLVDALIMPRLITPNTWAQYLHLPGIENALQTMQEDEPTILVTGHVGNWELLGYTLGILGFDVAALARPLDNPLLNRYLVDIREARGLRIITKFGATKELHSILDRGGMVGLLADQNAGEGGMFVPFFGRLASTYKSIGLLAQRYNARIVCGVAVRDWMTMRYTFTCNDIIRPEDWDDQPDSLYYISARVNRALEGMIRMAPEQYLWIHRRWKSRPRHERRGKPVPASLERKLRSLPWMTSDEVEAVIDHSNRMSAEQRRSSPRPAPLVEVEPPKTPSAGAAT